METALPFSSKVSLKLFIHKSTNRVLFAEAGKDFVDFFVNILRMPVGNLITILKPDIMLGSLVNNHDSIINLNPSIGSRMQPNLCRVMNSTIVSMICQKIFWWRTEQSHSRCNFSPGLSNWETGERLTKKNKKDVSMGGEYLVLRERRAYI